MKKLMIALAVASMSTAAMAQETTATQKKYSVATNNFWSNWFISAGGDYMAAYSDQEFKQGLPTSPMRKFRGSWGGNVAIGKWFTPVLGLRTKVYYGRIAQVRDKNPHHKEFGYVAEEIMFNISNLFCGYNSSRVWNFIVYAGGDVSRNFTDDAYSFAPRAGMMSSWRLGKRWNFNIEVYGMIGEENVDGTAYWPMYGTARGWYKAHDREVGASAGFTYNLGKHTWAKSLDCPAVDLSEMNGQIADLRAQLNNANNKLNAAQGTINDLNRKLADCMKKPVGGGIVSKGNLETMVLFRCNKTVIDAAQVENVTRVADYMKANPNSRVVIKGYASQEGPAAHNKDLSVSRANAVKNMLINKYGISSNRISAEGMGVSTMFAGLAANRVSINTVTE